MESFGTFLDEEWESLSRMFTGDQDSDHGLFSSEKDHGLHFESSPIVSSVMTESIIANPSFINNHGYCYAYENVNPNFYHEFSQETNASFLYPSSNHISLPTNGACDHEVPVEFYDQVINDNSSLLAQVFSNDAMEELLCLRQNLNIKNSVDPLLVPTPDKLEHTPAKRKIEMPESQNVVEDKVNDEKLKKTRVSRDNKSKKKVQPKKKQKVMEGNDHVEDANNNKVEGNPSSSSCSSEDELNGGTAINSNFKTRAGRGAATDPQSLYARKRRERINERLKVLQNLVPNGTKVDISTMLEEAVQYVKFLQLQIKLLSSDEMWMYAPIAYNGMDMGLYQKLAHS